MVITILGAKVLIKNINRMRKYRKISKNAANMVSKPLKLYNQRGIFAHFARQRAPILPHRLANLPNLPTHTGGTPAKHSAPRAHTVWATRRATTERHAPYGCTSKSHRHTAPTTRTDTADVWVGITLARRARRHQRGKHHGRREEQKRVPSEAKCQRNSPLRATWRTFCCIILQIMCCLFKEYLSLRRA